MFKKTISLFVAFMLVVAVFGGVTAKADQLSDLQAVIAGLQAQIAALMGGSSAAPATSATFTRDLSMGATGDDVMALQLFLNTEVGTSLPGTKYFGALTKAALVKFQVANGVPGTGYMGPMTRAAIAKKQAPVVVPPVTTTPGTGSTGSGITTPGVEGTLTVTVNPTPGSGLTLREGDMKKSVLGLKLEAKLSDINVQRVKVDLGASTIVYNKLFKHIYLLDGSTVIAESDLNSSTVVKDGSNYYITLAGFNALVAKDSTKVLTLALDAQSSIDSTYDSVATYGLLIPAEGVRGVDGAGLNQTGPTSAFSRRTVTIDADALVDAATISVSKNTSSPVSSTVIAADGTNNNEKDLVSLLTFNLKGTKSDLKVTDLVATISKGANGGTATATTAYLYDGDTVVGSASVASNQTATFSDIDYMVPADSTKTLTLKVDIRSANATAAVLTASVTGSSQVTVENTDGTSITPSGSATGEAISFRSAGAEISLNSKSISASSIDNGAGLATTTVAATFSVKIKALGDDLVLGKEASTSPMFASSTSYFVIYQGDTATAVTPSFLTFTIDDTNTTVSGQTATLAEDNEANVSVTVQFSNRTAAGVVQLTPGSYSVGIAGVSTNGSTVDTFMAGKTAWRTSPVAVQ